MPELTAKDENRALREIIKQTLWMARRYAHGRRTYVTSDYNDAARAAIKLGVLTEAELAGGDGTAWAFDPGGASCANLTDEEWQQAKEAGKP